MSAGQPVVRLAHAGSREAVIQLPETLRPAVGSVAQAELFGKPGLRVPATLRQLSDTADARTRTFEARYVLQGTLAAAPLGATVTIRIPDDARATPQAGLQVPIGALLDGGKGPAYGSSQAIWPRWDGGRSRSSMWMTTAHACRAHSSKATGSSRSARSCCMTAMRSAWPRRPPRSRAKEHGRERAPLQPVGARGTRTRDHAVPDLPDFACGAVSFFKLGRAEDPAFTVKVMTIVTAWPGATAQEMHDQVAEKIEKRMQELRWYDRSETYTRPGLAFTTLTLLDSTPPSEVQEQFYQARKKIGDVANDLPAGVIGPLVNDEYADVTFALFALKARANRSACWCAMRRRSASGCCMCRA